MFMKNTQQHIAPAELFVLLFLLLLSIGALIVSIRIAGFSSLSSPGAFPMFISLVMCVACLMILKENARYTSLPFYHRLEEIGIAVKKLFSPATIMFILLMAAYGFLLEVAGFLLSTLLFLWIATILLKGASPLHATWISLLNVAVVYIVFRHIFLVLLP